MEHGWWKKYRWSQKKILNIKVSQKVRLGKVLSKFALKSRRYAITNWVTSQWGGKQTLRVSNRNGCLNPAIIANAEAKPGKLRASGHIEDKQSRTHQWASLVGGEISGPSSSSGRFGMKVIPDLSETEIFWYYTGKNQLYEKLELLWVWLKEEGKIY